MSKLKRYIDINVYTAAKKRIAWIFDTVSKIYLSFSGGKDSTVMLHMVAEEAKKRNKKFGLLFVDLEGQYQLTISHIEDCYKLYADITEPYWVALPMHLRNAVSQYETHWTCWESGREKDWIRKPSKLSITDINYFPFFHENMEFEEFIVDFGEWYSKGEPTACIVGIRTDESLNRFRTIINTKKKKLNNFCWTTLTSEHVYNCYPLYDWKTEDLWIYHAKYPDLPYNKLYDRMYQAGLTLHQMRICQPYGDDQRRGLWLFHIIEPQTWSRVVARVNGANQGALYAEESGNILGNLKISKPEGHTWKSFAHLLLDSMPERTSEHFKNKIAVFLKWYETRGYPDDIPDDGPLDKSKPSWKRICKALLRSDYWCKGLSFTQHKSTAYDKYVKLMKRRRKEWNLMN